MACYSLQLKKQLCLANDLAVIDWVPISMDSQARSSQAKTAQGYANKGFLLQKISMTTE